MEKRLNELLRHALSPTDEPDFWLNQRILNQVKEQKEMTGRKRRFSIAVMAAVIVLCLSSVTVYAAWKYLSAANVADKVQDAKLAEAFLSEEAMVINETRHYAGYDVTLLSIVSGEMLSRYQHYDENHSVVADRSYAVVAIENSDGTPMPDTSEDAYGELEFFASLLIGGYDPAFHNIADMNGGYTEISEDGVLYRLLECDNVEIFTDRDLYLCVTEGVFYNREAYLYDEVSGEITRNEAYEGLNALFLLRKGEAKEKAQEPGEVKEDVQESGENVETPGTDQNVMEVQLAEESPVAEYALQFVGNPYAWGGESLTEGADSSGFVKAVYAHFDIELPRSSTEQRKQGIEVDGLANAQPGDLIFYDTPAHVAIYVGEESIIHADPANGITVSGAEFDDISGIRRIIAEPGKEK